MTNMAKAKVLSAALFCLFIITQTQFHVSHSLSCLPCSEYTCPTLNCVGGTHKAVCGCCQACAKQNLETCGGLWGLNGNCDKDLICYISPDQGGAFFGASGTCKLISSIARHDFICENSRKSIQCPSGQVITVISALYGREDFTTCPNGPIKTTKCEAPGSLTTIKRTCDGHNACSVHASNSVFNDPCYGTTKYVKMQYICLVSIRGIKATICENEKETITCPPGQVIRVWSGTYGRDDLTTCSPYLVNTTACKADGSLSKLERTCNEHNSCSVDASNSVFGDPCYGTTKYVKMHYKCYVPHKGIKVTICEGGRQNITCPSGQVISVLSGFYGRKESVLCPSCQIKTERCRAAGSLTKLRTKCNGQSSCLVYAGNSEFDDDPCYGTTKYVEMVYSCTKLKH